MLLHSNNSLHPKSRNCGSSSPKFEYLDLSRIIQLKSSEIHLIFTQAEKVEVTLKSVQMDYK